MYIKKNLDSITKVKFLTQYLRGHKGFIAGGCFKNAFKNEKIKDVDIFFRNEDDFNDALCYFEDDLGQNSIYENERVIAYKFKDVIIELIKQTYGTPEEVLSKFDFTITKFALFQTEQELLDDPTISKYEVIYHTDFFEHLLTNKLVIEKQLLFPVSTFERTLRYSKYGYGLCKESKGNLINALRGDNFNLDEISNNLYNGLD